MNLLIAGEPGASSIACCKLMKIEPMSISHHRVALKEGMMPENDDNILYNNDPLTFVNRKFRLQRTLVNYIQLPAFKSKVINKLFYDSIIADFLHEFLWFIRRNRTICNLLYGNFGAGEARRGGGDAISADELSR